MHWHPVHPTRPLFLSVRWLPAHLRDGTVHQHQRPRVAKGPRGLVQHWIPVHPARRRLLGVHWRPVHLRVVAVPRSLKLSQKQARTSTPWVLLPSMQEVVKVKEPEVVKLLEELRSQWSRRLL